MSKPVVFRGNKYNSMSALAKELGEKEKTIYDCIYSGRPVPGSREYVDYAFTLEEIQVIKDREKVQQARSISL